MPIPYMGSKRKSAPRIMDCIEVFSSGERGVLVDLFAGGFAVGEEALKRGYNVIANDANKYVMALLAYMTGGHVDESRLLEFVTREKFFDVLGNPDNYEPWYVGYVMCGYSFGNNQKGYLFGRDVEPVKHAGHDLVVYQKRDDIERLIPDIPKTRINYLLELPTWHDRRIELVGIARDFKKRILELEQLERLERLGRLQHLERLQQLGNLTIISGDYRDVIIPDGAIVYCDPPYKGTASYREGGFDHEEFWSWAARQSKTHWVFVSEYAAPEGFVAVDKFLQKSTLQGGRNTRKNHPHEHVFVHKSRMVSDIRICAPQINEFAETRQMEMVL